jgi:predicted CXXCH cytochrome family protein
MNKVLASAAIILLALIFQREAFSARESRISATKHNLSSSGPGTTKSSTESQICVFCHTPHGADTAQGPAPLWNKTLSGATYTPYSSSSLDAVNVQGASAGQPLGSSKLCLSCHDGVMALGSVRILRGQATVIGGGTEVTMPAGSGEATGNTRLLGTDLTNDHPVSITFDATLADRDGELRRPTMSTGMLGQILNRWGNVFGARETQGFYKPMLPLEPLGAGGAGQVQCTTCHDPHIRETDASSAGTGEGNIKFLRANRFQRSQPTSNYSATDDIICLACHDKGAGGNSWAYSAHANSQVATQLYTSTAAAAREFPKIGDTNPVITENLPVWKAACLNCHDTHTAPGARRLLRGGVSGGQSAIEETCYQCHTTSGASAVVYLNNTATEVPDIKTDLSLARRMPITSSNQAAGVEVHDIGGNFSDGSFVDCSSVSNKCGKDFIEQRAKLGFGNLTNRHAECTDCHNPHRVVKFRDFRGTPPGSITGTPDAAGTHPHTDTAMNHSNIASGVLRGSWGVEPIYGAASFHALPINFTVKRGDPGSSATSNVTDTYVTREYQICMKCHSDYGYSDNNVYPSGNRPLLGSFTGGTPTGTNGLTTYTNQAKEFQPPSLHQGEPLNLGNDAGSADSALATGRFNVRNHRSWHPVMLATGRDTTRRGITGANPWLPPWSTQVGSNTMYCTDCHGSNSKSATSVIPVGDDNGSPWGPHGSSNDFLLKGNWTDNGGGDANLLCFKCHVKAVYSSKNDSGRRSGFYDGSSGKGNLHNFHVDKIGKELRCTWCHAAVPHGWKNRSFLVNLNDVGEEAGQGAGSSKEVATNSSSAVYSQQPYYFKAKLKIASFATSGSWSDSNCGSVGKSGAGLTNGLISGSGGAGNTTGTGVDWMKSTCSNPP